MQRINFLSSLILMPEFTDARIPSLRPADVCRALLAALEAAEGRRRKRKRDQTPDTIGLSIKRCLLACAVQDDPGPDAFEEWLVKFPVRLAGAESAGAVAAMARSILEEWRLAHSMDTFRIWLERGAPSDDSEPDAQGERAFRGAETLR